VTQAFVADASVAVGWVHPGQSTTQTAAMLEAMSEGAALEVPALWPMEVANALTILVGRRKLLESERQTGLEWLRRLRVRIDHDMASLAFTRLSELATTHGLSVYDATYLELAHRRKLMFGMQGRTATSGREAGRRKAVGVIGIRPSAVAVGTQALRVASLRTTIKTRPRASRASS